jgi:hypothetical protein
VTDCHIHPERVYDTAALVLALDIPSAALTRARREGRLRHSRQGRRVYYLGTWVIDWLSGRAGAQEVPHHAS